MKKILVITQYFYPEIFRINDICTEWVNRGYDITVLTGIPNYPQGVFYDGYSQKYCEELWNNIKIVRLPIFPRGHSFVSLFKNCYSFVSLGIKWLNNLYKKNCKSLPFDSIFTFEVSPMTQALIGAYASKKYNVHSILYVQDLWPENVISVMHITNPLIIKPIEVMVEYIYKHTSIILATSKSFVSEICKRIKNVNAHNKVKFWPQYAEDFYVPMGKHVFDFESSHNKKSRYINEINELRDDIFKIVFTGNIGKTQGLDILVKLAKNIECDYNELKDRVKFIIVGDGRNKENLINQIKEDKVENYFLFIDKKPSNEIPAILGECDAGFVSFQDDDLFSKTIPAKLQSYLACGIPIIASAKGETKNIVEKAKCGLCNDMDDVNTLKNNICFMIKNKKEIVNMSKNARKYFQENFSKKILMDEIEKYL